jgi:hypothetical protein
VTPVKDHGVLLRPELVRAFLAGNKTVTRRTDLKKWRRAKPGDRIWFRETHANLAHDGYDPVWVYRADGSLSDGDTGADLPRPTKWTPSLLMPKRAARCWAEIEDIRKERLQRITIDEIWAEGVMVGTERLYGSPFDQFRSALGGVHPSPHALWIALWNSINGKKPGLSWADNPVVARIQFRRIEMPGGGE